MSNFTVFGFQFGIRSIEAAFRTSRQAFQKELETLSEEWDQYVAQRNKSPEETDRGYGDHLSDLHYEAETGLRLLREAFAMTVYHYWEKEVSSLFGEKDYVKDKILDRAIESGRFTIDEEGIERLRLIVNTIKHDKGAPLYRKEPGIFVELARELDPNAKKGWHHFLRLSDEDIVRGINAVKSSGPGKAWSHHGDECLKDESGQG